MMKLKKNEKKVNFKDKIEKKRQNWNNKKTSQLDFSSLKLNILELT